MKKTSLIIHAEGYTRRGIHKPLYFKEKDLFMKFKGKFWNFTKGEVSFYSVRDKINNKVFCVTFNNLHTIQQEITDYFFNTIKKEVLRE